MAMETISFEELRKVHLQEKHSSMLSPLPEEFLDVYSKYLSDFYTDLKGGFSIEGAKTYENCRNVFVELVRLRCQKIILKAFKDSKTCNTDSEGLTNQEKNIYISMLKLFVEYEAGLLTSKPMKPVQSNVAKTVKVEILLDVPEFVTPSGKGTGPFTAGTAIELDEATAILLIEKGAAKLS
ncbi:MAG: hypothetical protein V1722_05585 [Candidatus Micrarchaeota archaeon]